MLIAFLARNLVHTDGQLVIELCQIFYGAFLCSLDDNFMVGKSLDDDDDDDYIVIHFFTLQIKLFNILQTKTSLCLLYFSTTTVERAYV